MGLDNRDPRPGEIARVGGHRRQPVLNKQHVMSSGKDSLKDIARHQKGINLYLRNFAPLRSSLPFCCCQGADRVRRHREKHSTSPRSQCWSHVLVAPVQASPMTFRCVRKPWFSTDFFSQLSLQTLQQNPWEHVPASASLGHLHERSRVATNKCNPEAT